MCVWQMSVSAIFLLNKYGSNHIQTFETRPLTIAPMEVLNEGVMSKLVSRDFLHFDINIKERRSPGNTFAQGLNWKKESWDNACV